jgi:hypothetical protein
MTWIGNGAINMAPFLRSPTMSPWPTAKHRLDRKSRRTASPKRRASYSRSMAHRKRRLIIVSGVKKASQPIGESFLFCCFALPHHEHLPAKLFELGRVLKVTPSVSFQLWTPIVLACLRCVGLLASLVRMPKTTVDRDDLPQSSKNQIGPSG